MSSQNQVFQEAERSERDKWWPRGQNLAKEPRDLSQDRGHVVRGMMVKGFLSSPIARRNLSHFWEKTKLRRVNIKVLGPLKCLFKTLRRGPWLTHGKANMYIQFPSKKPLSTQQTGHHLCNHQSKPTGSLIGSKEEVVWLVGE